MLRAARTAQAQRSPCIHQITFQGASRGQYDAGMDANMHIKKRDLTCTKKEAIRFYRYIISPVLEGGPAGPSRSTGPLHLHLHLLQL